MNIIDGLTADDVLLVPKYSEIDSRSEVDLSVDLGRGIKLKYPVVSANMKSITGPEMAKAVADFGGLALLHRFWDYKDIPKIFSDLVHEASWRVNHIGCSVGVQEHDKALADECIKQGCKIICVDVAHGHSKKCLEMIYWLSSNYPDILLIAGNVATFIGAMDLHQAGADVIKVGIGCGSLCSTRIETGNGYPQLSAVESVFNSSTNGSNPRSYKIIADGGIRRAGDAVKYLCFSDAVMLGNVLAGTDEAPGDNIMLNGIHYKQYAGSSTHKSRHVEGVVGLVPSKGPVKDVLDSFTQGIKSGCSYQGSRNLTELKVNPQFVRITNAGLAESHPHSVQVLK